MADAAVDPYETVWSKPCRILRVGPPGGDRTLRLSLDAVHSVESRFDHTRIKKTLPSCNGLFAYDADGREIATVEQNEDCVRLDLAGPDRRMTILLMPMGSRSMPMAPVVPDRHDRGDSFRRALSAARCSIADALDPGAILSSDEVDVYARRSLAVIAVASERSGESMPISISATPGGPAVCAVRSSPTKVGPNLLTRRERTAWSLPPVKCVMSRISAQSEWDVVIGPHCAGSELADPVSLAAAIRSLPPLRP